MKWGRIVLVIFGALIITALGIDASDTLRGADGTLLSQVIGSKGVCPAGMVEVEAIPGITCVDAFEASTNTECPVSRPENLLQSHKNVETPGCKAVSLPNKVPWSFVSRDQALQLCAREGKRLPTNTEWYSLSLGMSDVEKSCNISSRAMSETGKASACVSASGAYDLVGNVWEWVSDDVINGTYNNRQLPDNGYVAQIDNAGIAIMTEQSEQELYGKDYFWSSSEGAFGMVRGGYYDSGTDAGIYTVHADTPANAASIGIGFRCVK
jgi:formylglycine-generating enzyme required for sulfatase activity